MQNLISIQRQGWFDSYLFATIRFLSFVVSSSHAQVALVDQSNNLGVIRHLSAQGCAFWGFRWYNSPFMESNTLNPNSRSANRHFHAKHAKSKKHAYYKNYRIDSNQILHNNKDHEILFLGGPNTHITNQRWQMAAIFKKNWYRHILATVWPIDIKFGTVTCTD